LSATPLSDANAQQALLEQLADAAQRNADALASQGSVIGALRARLAEMEGLAREREQTDLRRNEQVERLAAAVDRLLGDHSLAGQVEALGAQQVRLAERAEQLAVDLRRIDQLQAALTQLGRELTGELTSRDHALRSELQAQSRQRLEESERLNRSLQPLVARGEAITAMDKTLESLARQQTDLLRQLQAQDARLSDLAASLGPRDEQARQQEQRLRAAIQDSRAQMQELAATVGRWQGHLEAQSETLREARGMVEQARLEADRLRVEHHASKEQTRVAAERVDAALVGLREESAGIWEQFLTRRRQDWTTLAQERLAERQTLADEFNALRSGMDAELAALSEGLSAGLELGRQDLDSLRHRMGLFMLRLRDSVLAGAESFDVDLPSGDPGAQSPERRQALRRALRARRQAGGGP
jgi:DNA repair exonuclease SbcCD ATPase subunit